MSAQQWGLECAETKAGLLDPRYVAIFVKEYHEMRARRTAEIKAERSVLERKLKTTAEKVQASGSRAGRRRR